MPGGSPRYLFAGLGNPEPHYFNNRHNVGFRAVEAIHRRYNFDQWRERFNSMIAEGEIDKHRVLLLKPQTFMNASGIAVQKIQSFYKLSEADLFVFHDEIEIPLGTIHIKRGGSDAGHKGLRSITLHCGPYYTRIRIGVGRPKTKFLVESHVLSDFAPFENYIIDFLCETIADLADYLLSGRFEQLQNHVRLSLREKFSTQFWTMFRF